MTIIPILPLRIVDMVMSPVPVLIGLTRPEHLDSTVESRVCVNCDIKLVIDTPVFEADSPLRLKILDEQLKFQQVQTQLLQNWKGAPGFPHEIFCLSVQRFIAWYLQVYIGACASSEDLKANIDKFPEYILGSQVFSQLSRMDELTPERREEFQAWFARVFAFDMGKAFRKSVEVERPSQGEPVDDAPPPPPPVALRSHPHSDDKRRRGWTASLFIKTPAAPVAVPPPTEEPPAPAPTDGRKSKPGKKHFWQKSKE
jgi:hypothetical protein